MNAKLNIMYVGSSHFSPRRHFGNHLQGPYWSPRIGKMLTLFGIGSYLEKKFMKQIMHEIREHFPKDCTLIVAVMLSCNWLRSHPEDLDSIYQAHVTLISKLWDLTHVRLVICGNLPCPKTHHYTKIPFRRLDGMLRKLQESHTPKMKFFDTAPFFMENEHRKNEKIKHYLFEDRLHLNNAGADLLSRELNHFILEQF